MHKRIEQLLQFSRLIGGLKDIERWRGHFYWKHYPQRSRYESVADHSWRLAVLVILIEGQLDQRIDFAKAIKMALLHDLPEVLTGDPSPLGQDGTGKTSHAYSKKVAHTKFIREQEAARNLFAVLPNSLAFDLFNIWSEYEAQTTFESKVVKALDKIEAKLQAAEYLNGKMFKDHLTFNLTYAVSAFNVDPSIQHFGALILKQMQSDFSEFKQENG